MALDDKPSEPIEGDHADFMPAVFARSMKEAEEYCELLGDHGIPTIIGDESDLDEDHFQKTPRRASAIHRLPILVPEVMLDEADEIIALLEEVNNFNSDDEYSLDEEGEELGFCHLLGDGYSEETFCDQDEDLSESDQ